MSYVYFISFDSGPIKIGKADDVDVRVRQLQTANPYSLEVLYAWELPDQMAHPVEHHLHERFADARMRGEWFARTPALMGLIANLKRSGTRSLDGLAALAVDQVMPRHIPPESDPLDGFYPGVLADAPGAWMSRAEVYALYQEWCNGAAVPPRVLYGALRGKGVQQSGRGGTRGFKGLCAAPDHRAVPDLEEWGVAAPSLEDFGG